MLKSRFSDWNNKMLIKMLPRKEPTEVYSESLAAKDVVSTSSGIIWAGSFS
jgi:hypothetical protein